MASLTLEECTAHRTLIFMRGSPGDEVDSESKVKGHEFVTYADADLAGEIGSRKQ